MALFSAVYAAVGLAQAASGLYTFKFSNEAGGTAVSYALYFICGELVWRTKEASATMGQAPTTTTTTTTTTAAGNKSEATNKKKPYTYDRVSSVMCAMTLAATSIAANVACIRNHGPRPTPLAGRIAAAAGIAFSFWLRRASMLELGSRFTCALAKVKEHTVCNTGPYRWMRHGGYTANIVLITSYAYLMTGNVKQTAVHAGIALAMWLFRVSAEETMLLADEDLGAPYKAYMEKVRAKFFPFLL